MRRGPLLDLLRFGRPSARISAVGLLAYDWKKALQSVASYYPIAEEILLGLDKERISWSGKRYSMDLPACRRALKRLDPQGKIRILEGNFHSQAQPMANDTAERRFLASQCRPGNWVMQVDADEILMNAREFADWLALQRAKRQVLARWITVFKVIGGTALVIDSDREWIPVATRQPNYYSARETHEWARRSPLRLLHFSWGRSPAELQTKLKNWSHSSDFDTEALLKLWRGVTLKNYAWLKNFHPLDPPLWPGLKALPLKNLGRD